MKVLYSILIFIMSVILSSGTVYAIFKFFFDEVSNSTGAWGEALGRLVIGIVLFLVLLAVFHILGTSFLL